VGGERYQEIVWRGMVIGFTYRGHQIFLLIYRGDVRPVCLLADDLAVEVMLHRGTIPPHRNDITTYRNAIGILLTNALGFSFAFLCVDKGENTIRSERGPAPKCAGNPTRLPLLTEGVFILEFGTHCGLTK